MKNKLNHPGFEPPKTGYDFMCTGEQHHSYHVGVLLNNYLSSLYLHTSCNFPSRYREILLNHQKRILFSSRLHQVKNFFKEVVVQKKEVAIIGIDTMWIPLVACLAIFGTHVEIHLHGQIAGLLNGKKRFFWFLVSRFVTLVVANPIYAGPKFVRSIGNIGAFDFAKPKTVSKQQCLLYGSNKAFLQDEKIKLAIADAGYSVTELLSSSNKYVSTNDIIRAAENASHTFVSLNYDHYKLSPSGRICDLRILRLKPLVDLSDQGTQKILSEYGIGFDTIQVES